ncbi:MAG TPA: aminotransferase class IV [Vicinamibacteria bacterium]|nr:aminotransferase class IV [Vicinamibacteria bacterium]
MVETFVLADGVATPVRSSLDLATASAALPTGAYTTLRTYGGDGIVSLEEHLARLEESTALQGRPGRIDRGRLRAGLAAVLRATRYPESRLRITFTPPELFASVEPFTPLPDRLYEEGAWCVTLPLRRDVPHSKDTRFVSSAQAAYRDLPKGAHEGLLVAEDDGAILEGLSSNVFAVVDGVLRTEDERALRGTTRSAVLDLARGILPVSLEAPRRGDLPRASEVFLTSVSREVLGVARIDDIEIGRGRPGALARDLRKRYRARMRSLADHVVKR